MFYEIKLIHAHGVFQVARSQNLSSQQAIRKTESPSIILKQLAWTSYESANVGYGETLWKS